MFVSNFLVSFTFQRVLHVQAVLPLTYLVHVHVDNDISYQAVTVILLFQTKIPFVTRFQVVFQDRLEG